MVVSARKHKRAAGTNSSRVPSRPTKHFRVGLVPLPQGATMNIFRLIGDMSHLASILLLLLKLRASKSAAGERYRLSRDLLCPMVLRVCDLWIAHPFSVHDKRQQSVDDRSRSLLVLEFS